ncbi:RNA-binding protein [Pollutibacter soli]|uniref:RNA recognition motif domain-containing protein n=1 Tax=Pollutibacter soli TaxID=3034157 RepID=UPI0030133A44
MNLYVSNLGYQTSESELRKLFEPFGPVTSVKIIMDRDTGSSRGFGFVDMESKADAETAIKSIDGQELSGRQISVAEAREKPKSNFKSRF